MVTRGKEQLSIGHVCAQSSQVKVIGEGVEVEQDLDVIRLVQEGVDGKLWGVKGSVGAWSVLSA